MKEVGIPDGVQRSQLRRRIVERMMQPVTARQLAQRFDIPLGKMSHALRMLEQHGLAMCMNSCSVRSRVYWLTGIGQKIQLHLRRDQGLPEFDHDFPIVDWDLYGWVCHSHRSAVIKALDHPLQPSEIKRRALQQDPNLRMSANNVRDIIRLYLAKGIVQPVLLRKKKHPLYDLTSVGRSLRQLLYASHAPAHSAF